MFKTEREAEKARGGGAEASICDHYRRAIETRRAVMAYYDSSGVALRGVNVDARQHAISEADSAQAALGRAIETQHPAADFEPGEQTLRVEYERLNPLWTCPRARG